MNPASQIKLLSRYIYITLYIYLHMTYGEDKDSERSLKHSICSHFEVSINVIKYLFPFQV